VNAPHRLSASRYASQAAMERTLRAAKKAGLDVAGVEALPDGTIRVVEARAAGTTLFDELEQAGKL
jgi:hypothetical protein